MLSQTAEYALRAALQLAQQQADEPLQAAELASRLRLPRNYLSKTLHGLARAGVLASARGKGGGFRLARPAARITLADVIAPFDQLDGPRRCLLGRAECSDRQPCVAHRRWQAARQDAVRFYRTTTLAALLREEASGDR
jgi:Rrf2 family protein